ncbi:phosphatase PAP2 family protein [Solirubrobacter sp. CPCC 204708]|uniref:Phosphatase PAP2 family protein n=1 Tax=Solirubrobacter deserti TaxID=2282478 RepID=A0ABT4RJ44_9ACTN|nr:phosphatase PAP2 family protein [Solirubrobacter deserti]MBE2317628.1 phosphatase PAP2 family protein [Solirubrobacter deserti]MDA0138578.1 phosphatase PAP2 family protein [Solirubrobacter deserti]
MSDRWVPALLRPRPSGPAARVVAWLPAWPPAAVFVVALLAGFVAFAAVSVLLGTLVTEVVLGSGGIRDADEGVVDELAAGRTPLLDDVSSVVSWIGGGPALASLAGLVALVAAVRRNWLIAVFVACLLPVETAAYRLTLNLVARDRPGVERLDGLPLGGSYPSGHSAASVAVYAGLMLLVIPAVRSRHTRAIAWTIAVAVPMLVALSRLYRGMHHPLDVVGGVVVGLGTLTVVVFACRAAASVTRPRPADR